MEKKKIRNSRVAGHNWERECRTLFRESGLFPDCETSRFESKKMDDMKVDLCGTGKYYFQCKNVATRCNYAEILDQMPKDGHHNIILEKLTKRKGSRFVQIGQYVHMDLKTLISILDEVRFNNNHDNTVVASPLVATVSA